MPPTGGIAPSVRFPGQIQIWEPGSYIMHGDHRIPLLTIGNRSIPLFAVSGMASWALMNLILCALGVIFAAVTVLRVLLKRRRQKEDENIKTPSNNEYGDSEYIESTQEQSEEQKSRKRHRLAWLIIVIAMGIIGVLLFILTQNMRWTMVLLDIWTIAHAVLFAAEAVAMFCLFRRKKNKKDKNDNGHGQGAVIAQTAPA